MSSEAAYRRGFVHGVYSFSEAMDRKPKPTEAAIDRWMNGLQEWWRNGQHGYAPPTLSQWQHWTQLEAALLGACIVAGKCPTGGLPSMRNRDHQTIRRMLIDASRIDIVTLDEMARSGDYNMAATTERVVEIASGAPSADVEAHADILRHEYSDDGQEA